MNTFLLILLALVGIVSYWHCYRLGHAEGRAEGFDEGRTRGLLEGAGITVPVTQ